MNVGGTFNAWILASNRLREAISHLDKGDLLCG